MKNEPAIIETMFILQSLATNRQARLADISRREMLRDHRDVEWMIDPITLTKIEYDNIMTDIAMENRFVYPHRTSQDAIPLHFKHCMDNSISECSCLPDRAIQGVDLI